MASSNDRFNDLFHAFGDDEDEQNDPYVAFDNLYQNINKEDEIQLINQFGEEQHLSQKLSQLSTSTDEQSTTTSTTTKKRSPLTPVTPVTTIKKMKTIDIVEEKSNDDKIPNYLSSNNATFEQMINRIVQKSDHTIDIEDLRQIAYFKHKLALLNLNISLYTTYLQSGTSKLKENEQTILSATYPYLSIWPKELTVTMLEDKSKNFKQTDLNHDTYLNYVNDILHSLKNQHIKYQAQLDERKQKLTNYFTLEIEELINKFVEQYGIISYRIPIEGKIAIVNYDYNDRLIEHEFYRELPYQPQIDTFTKLTQSKLDKEIAKMNVAVLKQRLLYNHLPNTFDSLQISLPDTLIKIQNENIRQRLIDRSEKIVQRTKSDMMMIYILTEETKFNEYKMKFDTDMAEMHHRRRLGSPDKKLTETMLNIMERRFKNINERLLCLYNLKVHFFVNAPTVVNNSCSPTITLDTSIHYLSSEQLIFLNRGPSYVLPCQIHLLSTSLTLNEILIQQLAPLRRQLTKMFTKYKVDLSCRMNFEKEIQKQFIQSFSLPIPKSIQERVLYEKQLIQSIQYQLKQNQLILRRTADNNNTYYLGQLDKFIQMANEYLINANCYEIIRIIDDNNHTEQQQLNEIIQSIDLKLEQLRQKKLITQDHLIKLQIGKKKSNMNLPSLYFLPETHQDGHISLQSRFTSYENTPIQILATFLDQLLRPLFNNVSQSTTFHNGHDFIQKLQCYCIQEDLFVPSTIFVTFKIHNLHTRVSHANILTALNRFLVQATDHCRHEKLSSDTIEELTRLVLENNIFIYNGKIYRHIKGSSLNLSFIQLLLNIFLHNWQSSIVREMRLTDQFYGRYYDIGFMTWYGSTDRLQMCFNELNEQYPDIQLTTSMGSHVHFLNAYIENQKGNLYTRIYHDLTKQPFLLPYVTGHPRLIYRQWFRFIIIRAGLYCCSWEDFNEERLYIELTFLANGYSLDFIQYHLQQFFSYFNPIEKRIILNRWTYPSFRNKLFRYLNDQKYNLEEELDIKNHHPIIQLHYLFDWGNRCEFNKKFYELWSTFLNTDPIFKKFGLKIKLHSKHYYLSNTLLTQ